jgi:hypothetical protein
MEYFDTLGATVTRLWRKCRYNEERFPEVASEALATLPPHEHVSLWDVVQQATNVPQLPFQVDLEATFGDPPLTTYIGRGWHIQVLFWAEGVPAVHQHAFSGAFSVMNGSSIHTLWTFKPVQRLEMRLILGEIRFRRAEILLPGDIRPILAGDQMYHSTYHLERPSVTVVVRTDGEADQRPQYALLPPTIAHAQLDQISTVKRQTQLMKMLLVSGRRSEYLELAHHLLATKEPYSIFQLLYETLGMVPDEDDREKFWLTARNNHPQLVEALEPALARQELGNRIIDMYRAVESPDLKYFLALVRNVPERTAFFELVRHRYPQRDPITLTIRWLRRLSNLGTLGVRWHDSWLSLLECLLREHTLHDAYRTYLERCPTASGPRTEAELRELSSMLRTSALLSPLFIVSPESRSSQVAQLEHTAHRNDTVTA